MSNFIGELPPGTLFYKKLRDGSIVTLVSIGTGYAFGYSTFHENENGTIDYSKELRKNYDKCRFEAAQVLQIEKAGTVSGGKKIPVRFSYAIGSGSSIHDAHFVYPEEGLSLIHI